MKKQLIIGLIGKSGSGKTTVADYLHAYYGVSSIAFATPLKEALSIIFNEDFEKGDRNIPIPGTTVCKRKIMCDVSDYLKSVDSKVFINAANEKLKSLYGYTAIQFTDVRYKDEVKFLKKKGAIFIEIVRPDAAKVPFEHDSEQGDFSGVNRIIIQNTGTLADLYSEIDKALIHYLEYFE